MSRPSPTSMSRRSALGLLALIPVTVAAGCAEPEDGAGAGTGGSGSEVNLKVYKDPTCGCCEGWIEHVEADGFTTVTKHPDSLERIFADHDVPADLQSCHLAETASGAIVIGHVPAHFIREYLSAPPEGSRGLTVPAMPVGSPGMEQGEQFEPYEVLLLTKGEPTVFAQVAKQSDQA